MPAKSRRNRSKSLPPSKRIKEGTVLSSTAPDTEENEPVQPVVARQTAKPVAAYKVPAGTAETIISYTHIKAELTTIGILAVIMLALLGILAAVL